jgi:hypothetical protein
MSWLQQLGGLLGRYAGGGPGDGREQDDFDQFARAAPPDTLAQGIADAFRSDRTPPFAEMAGHLWGQSDPDQRAGMLNTLVGALGPGIVQQILGGMFSGGQVSPHDAARVPTQAFQQLAGLAEQRDPGIIDHLSGYVARNPGLFGALGAGALSAALGGLAQRHQGSGVLPASQDPYGDPADGSYGGGVLPASQDPYGDPADQYQGQPVYDSSQDPYGDPADGMANVLPSSQDPFGDPADRR